MPVPTFETFINHIIPIKETRKITNITEIIVGLLQHNKFRSDVIIYSRIKKKKKLNEYSERITWTITLYLLFSMGKLLNINVKAILLELSCADASMTLMVRLMRMMEK